jgi:hypothetical protein
MNEGAINITVSGLVGDADLARKIDQLLQVMVSRPKSKRYDDDFYRRVARAYVRAKHQAGNPVKVMAEANKVPVSTIQRWVREARRRGMLIADRPLIDGDRCPTCQHIMGSRLSYQYLQDPSQDEVMAAATKDRLAAARYPWGDYAAAGDEQAPKAPLCLPNAEDVPLLTVDQVVRASGGALKRSATYEAIRRGQIASVKVGRKTFIPTAALRRLWGLDDEGT